VLHELSATAQKLHQDPILLCVQARLSLESLHLELITLLSHLLIHESFARDQRELPPIANQRVLREALHLSSSKNLFEMYCRVVHHDHRVIRQIHRRVVHRSSGHHQAHHCCWDFLEDKMDDLAGEA